MATDKSTQKSATFGLAVFGKMIFGEILSDVGGLQRSSESGASTASPWRRQPIATTPWTRA